MPDYEPLAWLSNHILDFLPGSNSTKQVWNWSTPPQPNLLFLLHSLSWWLAPPPTQEHLPECQESFGFHSLPFFMDCSMTQASPPCCFSWPPSSHSHGISSQPWHPLPRPDRGLPAHCSQAALLRKHFLFSSFLFFIGSIDFWIRTSQKCYISNIHLSVENNKQVFSDR